MNNKSMEAALENEYISKDLIDIKNDNTGDNSKEKENRTNLFDSQTGAAHLKINPLKGLSSSIKPHFFKSIGVQVGPGKRYNLISNRFQIYENLDYII